jgi:hypothetical protein
MNASTTASLVTVSVIGSMFDRDESDFAWVAPAGCEVVSVRSSAVQPDGMDRKERSFDVTYGTLAAIAASVGVEFYPAVEA